MIVVCDTSAICYLVLIDEVELLPRLFGEIQIPEGVRAELIAPGSPRVLQMWIREPPAWLHVRTVPADLNKAWGYLHRGEREVLALAQHLAADLVILDEKAARSAALALDLRLTGLLGILDSAAKDHLLDLLGAVQRLRRTSFRAAPVLYQRLLQRHSARRSSSSDS